MKSTYFTKVKAFLQRNKILFDIFSSILLSSMALIVSINSCQISKQQSINEERLNIPLIKVSSEQFSNKETNDSEKITIENVGGYAYNYKIQKKVFLSCEYNPLNGEATKQIYLPIDDILDTSSQTNNYIGPIKYYYTISTMKYFHDLYQKTIEVEKGYLHIRLLKYIMISYNDFKDQTHKELFSIDGVFQGCKIEETDDINKLFSLQYPTYRISKITLEQIFKLIKLKPEH